MPESVEGLVLTIIALLVIIIFVGSIYAFVHAIILFIFSAGDPDKVKKAWNSIRYMILGIFLTLFFLFVFPLVFKRMNFPGYEKFSANNIFSHTSEILKSLFDFGKEAANEYQGGGSTNPAIYSPNPNGSTGSSGAGIGSQTSGGATGQGGRQLEL